MEEPDLPSNLLERPGALRAAGITTVPEEYGGFGGGFSDRHARDREDRARGLQLQRGHRGARSIGTLPILYTARRSRSGSTSPKLASGEWKAYYCLTEPGSSNDNNNKTGRASADGKSFT